MKVIQTKNRNAGVAMTEYLIILAVVALGCIAIFGSFGKQIKYTVNRVIHTLQGGELKDGSATAESGQQAAKRTGMADFIEAGK